MKVAHIIARNVIPEGLLLPVTIISDETGKVYMSHKYNEVQVGETFISTTINCLKVNTFTVVS